MDLEKAAGEKGGSGKVKGRDAYQDIEIDFEDAVKGFTTQLSVSRNEKCSVCAGAQ